MIGHTQKLCRLASTSSIPMGIGSFMQADPTTMRKVFALNELFFPASLHGIQSQAITLVNATLDKDVVHPMLGFVSLLKRHVADALVGAGNIMHSLTNINDVYSSIEVSSLPNLLQVDSEVEDKLL